MSFLIGFYFHGSTEKKGDKTRIINLFIQSTSHGTWSLSGTKQYEQSEPAYLVFINELPFQDIYDGSVAGIKKHFNEWGCH